MLLEVTQFTRSEFEAINYEIFTQGLEAVKKYVGEEQARIAGAVAVGTNTKPMIKTLGGFLFIQHCLDPESELNKKQGGRENVLSIRVLKEFETGQIGVEYALKVPERTLEEVRLQAEEEKKAAERAAAKIKADEEKARDEVEKKRKDDERASKDKKAQAKRDRDARLAKSPKKPLKKKNAKPYKNGQHSRPKAP